MDTKNGGENEKIDEHHDASSGGDSDGVSMDFPQWTDLFSGSDWAASAYGDRADRFGQGYLPGESSGISIDATVYNKWCQCGVSAKEILAWDKSNQNRDYRQKAIDALAKALQDSKHPINIQRPEEGGYGYTGVSQEGGGKTWYKMSDARGRTFWVDKNWNLRPSAPFNFWTTDAGKIFKEKFPFFKMKRIERFLVIQGRIS